MTEKENIDKIDQLLDEQISIFPTGVDTFKAKRYLNIKMVNTNIEFLHINGVNSGIIVCGICTIDGIHYAALCNPSVLPISGYVEEVHLTPGKNDIKTTKLIKDPQEWSVIVDFFQKNNVWETKKIFNWIWAVKNGQININKNWLQTISKNKNVDINDIVKSSTNNINAITKNKRNKNTNIS